MATLLKIRGLDRGDAVSRTAAGSVVAGKGFRVPSGNLTQVVGATGAVRGVLARGAGNAAVTYTANWFGASGNNVQVAHVAQAGTLPRSIVVTYAASTGYPTITVNPATTAGAINAGETADVIAAAVNADPVASQYVTATSAAAGTATTVTAAAAAPLATGADGTLGTTQALYFIANSRTLVVVDLDDTTTRKMLRRNTGRYVSLGQP